MKQVKNSLNNNLSLKQHVEQIDSVEILKEAKDNIDHRIRILGLRQEIKALQDLLSLLEAEWSK